MKIAAFVVDAQKGFTPICPNELPIPDGDTIVPELLRMIDASDIVVGSKDAHPDNAVWIADENQAMLTPLNFQHSDLVWNRHCVVGTKGFELLDGLPEPMDFDYFVWKGIERDVHPYGACYHGLNDFLSTGVIEFLKSKHVDKVIVGGLAYDYCVGTTVKQLVNAGFNVVLYEPACKGISPEGIDKMREELKDIGVDVRNDLDI